MCTKFTTITLRFKIFFVFIFFMHSGFCSQPADPKIYAVVIGVSKYADTMLNLKYAARDAEAFAAFLKTPNCGSTPNAQIALLVNENATRVKVIDAIKIFAHLATSNDILIIYFAGHGSNTSELNEFFMETYDTQKNDLDGTATPAQQVERILRSSQAKMTFWITDACNSGNIKGIRGGMGSGAERYLKAAAKARRGGFVYLASSESQETTLEGPEYGGGHGVFTYYLIEGLKGKADADRNGIVTITESYNYVHEMVVFASNGSQTPMLGDMYFNGKFPMSAPFNYEGLKTERRQFRVTTTKNGRRGNGDDGDDGTDMPYFNQTLPINSLTETHIPVKKGETVLITATGSINVGPWVGLSGPQGRTAGLIGFPISHYSIVKSFNHAVLMFKLAKADAWTACGANFKFTADKNGELIFQVNDNDQGNNSGAYTVNIQKFQ